MADQRRKGEKTRAKREMKRHAKADIYGDSPEVHVQRLRDESDRGVIVLLGSYVEEALELSLRDALGHASEHELDETFFGPQGLVGTFSAKANLAHALGLISTPARELIDVLRHLRNLAAHVQQSITFETSSVRQAALSMMCDDSRVFAENNGSESMRDMFVVSCIVLRGVACGRGNDETGTSDFTYAADFIAQHEVIPTLDLIRLENRREG